MLLAADTKTHVVIETWVRVEKCHFIATGFLFRSVLKLTDTGAVGGLHHVQEHNVVRVRVLASAQYAEG